MLHLGTKPWEQSGRAPWAERRRLPAAAFTRLRGCQLRTGVGLPSIAPEVLTRPSVTEKLAGHTREGDYCLIRATKSGQWSL